MTRLPGRFNDRACALLDIPDLPIHAFQHIGDHKIKPQGGGGGGGVVPIIATVVAVVATVYAGPAVGAAIANSMGATLGATGTAALGAAAIGGATSAVNAAIAGGDINDVLKAGAIGAAAGAVGGGVSANVPAGAGAIGRGAISGAASGATGASLRGQDVGRGAAIGGVAVASVAGSASVIATALNTQALRASTKDIAEDNQFQAPVSDANVAALGTPQALNSSSLVGSSSQVAPPLYQSGKPASSVSPRPTRRRRKAARIPNISNRLSLTIDGRKQNIYNKQVLLR